MWTIYKITNKLNGKIYVGKTTDIKHRAWKHLAGHTGPAISSAIKKYGKGNFVISVIEEFVTEEVVDQLEQYWISELKSSDRKYGYNLTHGGDGQRCNEETKKKISSALKGMWAGEKNPNYGNRLSDEARKRISLANKGRIRSEHAKQKTSEKLKGRKFSDAHRAKISASKKGIPMSQKAKEKLRAAKLGIPSPCRGVPKTPQAIRNSVEAKRRNREARMQMLASKP